MLPPLRAGWKCSRPSRWPSDSLLRVRQIDSDSNKMNMPRIHPAVIASLILSLSAILCAAIMRPTQPRYTWSQINRNGMESLYRCDNVTGEVQFVAPIIRSAK